MNPLRVLRLLISGIIARWSDFVLRFCVSFFLSLSRLIYVFTRACLYLGATLPGDTTGRNNNMSRRDGLRTLAAAAVA